jgi:hypothetical protein
MTQWHPSIFQLWQFCVKNIWPSHTILYLAPVSCICWWRQLIDAACHDDVIAAIKSFPNGSAGGLDGLRPQHLKELTNTQRGYTGEQLIDRLTCFTNLVLEGRVAADIRPIFCGAFLYALSKKEGGIRPIAVGFTLRRLVARVAFRIACRNWCTIYVSHLAVIVYLLFSTLK